MSQAEKRITQHLDIWSSTVKAKNTQGRGSSKKIELYGIKKLRELILELAVRGLLVSQDPNDEPASELLKKIAKEKAKLIKDKKIKKPKLLPPIIDDEQPFILPIGWEFVRLNDLGEWGAGATPSRGGAGLYGGSIPWFKSGELNEDFISESEETVTELALAKASLRFNKSGDVLIAMYGATIGKTSILKVAATTNQAVCACTVFPGFSNLYLLTLLKAYRPRFIGMGAGGAQPNISREKIIATVIALPPTQEQHRIVAKVDELMTLCDQLEQQQESCINAHQTLVQTLLAALTNACEKDEFESAWARIAEHFHILFTTESSINQLKQTILQLAVMGKLVPQNPNDEPASELLKKIAKEKTKLIKEGKIKKQKPLPPISEDEKPFELPKGWAWSFLGWLSSDIHYGYTASAEHENKGIRLLRITDIQEDKVNWETVPGCEITDKKSENYLLENNDILIARTGGTIGKSYLVENINVKAVFASYLIRVKRISAMYAPYIKTYLGSAVYWVQLYDNASGTGQPNVNATALKQLLVPIPPVEEQHHIVTKVDQLMALCDQLKAQINTSQTTQLSLADAVGFEVLGEDKTVTKNIIEEKEAMKISTQLTLGAVKADDTALIAKLVKAENGTADAKKIWSKTKLDLPEFYKQLKKEIKAGFLAKPNPAELEG